jgi:protein O-GlcNAc transferase
MIQNSAGYRLVYVCEEVLEPMQRYGRQMARICDQVFGTAPPHRAAPATRQRRRIGVVSSNFGWHSVSRVWRDLILGVERDTLELVCFKLDDTEDASTAEWRRRADVFVDAQGDLAHWYQCIAAADLDVVIFLDLGPDAVGYALATRRCAPVQCTTWAFPATSGLATIDYFLSSDLMEPAAEVARGHYLETLVRLPGLACSYVPHETLTKVAAVAKPRREVPVQFLCAQSHLKLLPAHDTLFARVLAATPDSLLCLSHGGGAQASRALNLRLGPVLNAAGVDAATRLKPIEQMPYSQFLDLLAGTDVVLDSLLFSGCLTSLDALSFNLPIVTLPGTTMRGRQTAAMLELLGLPALIANDEDDYVRIATRLAQEPDWRHSIREHIAAHKHRLYDIEPSVRGLETFLRTVQPR